MVLHSIWLDELGRAEEIINEYFPQLPGLKTGWGGRYLTALLSLVRGDPEPLRNLVDEWIADRDKEEYVNATIISHAVYELH